MNELDCEIIEDQAPEYWQLDAAIGQIATAIVRLELAQQRMIVHGAATAASEMVAAEIEKILQSLYIFKIIKREILSELMIDDDEVSK